MTLASRKQKTVKKNTKREEHGDNPKAGRKGLKAPIVAMDATEQAFLHSSAVSSKMTRAELKRKLNSVENSSAVKAMKLTRKGGRGNEGMDVDQQADDHAEPFTDIVYKMYAMPPRFPLSKLKQKFNEKDVQVEFMKSDGLCCIVSPDQRKKLKSFEGETLDGVTLKFDACQDARPSLQVKVLNVDSSIITPEDLRAATGCDAVKMTKADHRTLVEVNKLNDVRNLRKKLKLNGEVVQLVHVKRGPICNISKRRGKQLVRLILPEGTRKNLTVEEIAEATHGRVVKFPQLNRSKALLWFKDVESAREVARRVTLTIKGTEMELFCVVESSRMIDLDFPIQPVQSNDPVYEISGVPHDVSLSQLKKKFDEANVDVAFMKLPSRVFCIINEEQRDRLLSISSLKFALCTEVGPASQIEVSPFDPALVSADDLKDSTDCQKVVTPSFSTAVVKLEGQADVDKLSGKVTLNGQTAQVFQINEYWPEQYKALLTNDKSLVQVHISNKVEVTVDEIERATGGCVIQHENTRNQALLTFKDGESARKVAQKVALNINGIDVEISLSVYRKCPVVESKRKQKKLERKSKQRKKLIGGTKTKTERRKRVKKAKKNMKGKPSKRKLEAKKNLKKELLAKKKAELYSKKKTEMDTN